MPRDTFSNPNEESMLLRGLEIIRRRRVIAVVVFAITFASGLSFALYLPNLYRATASRHIPVEPDPQHARLPPRSKATSAPKPQNRRPTGIRSRAARVLECLQPRPGLLVATRGADGGRYRTVDGETGSWKATYPWPLRNGVLEGKVLETCPMLTTRKKSGMNSAGMVASG